MKPLLLCAGLSALLAVGCVVESPTTENSEDAIDSSSRSSTAALIGSWSITRPEYAPSGDVESMRRNFQLPEQPCRTVAGLILRSDGTYDAQLSPRYFPERYVDDTHLLGMRDGLESIGGWQGTSGSYGVDQKLVAVVTTREANRLDGRREAEQWLSFYDGSGRKGRTLYQPHLEEARADVTGKLLLSGRRFTDTNYASRVVDLGLCASDKSPALFAAGPFDAEASVSAPTTCKD